VPAHDNYHDGSLGHTNIDTIEEDASAT